MRLGISSYTYGWAVGIPGHPPEHPMGPFDLLDRARELDVSVVQIADNMPLDALPPDDLNSLADRAGEMGITVEVGMRGAEVERLCAYLDIAKRFDSPILRVVPAHPEGEPEEDEIVSALRSVLPECERAGVCLAVENYEHFTAEVWARIVRSVGGPAVGACLDTTNSLGAGEGIVQVVEALGPLAVNLHVKDFVTRRLEHRLGLVVAGCPAGQGLLDIPWLLGRLREMGRDPNAILELWTAPEERLADTIAKEAEWARASVAYMRTLIPG